MIYLLVKAGWDVVRHVADAAGKKTDKEKAVDQIIIVLIAFTLLFAANLAVGRVCLGLGSATSSRYTPYITPAFLGLYLFAVTRKKIPIQLIGLCTACFFITTFSIGYNNRVYVENIYRGKQRWKQAYLQTEDIYLSDRLSGFAIHPNPEYTHLKEKLDYLKEHHLNLYLDEPGK
jgi:hypothetical protein